MYTYVYGEVQVSLYLAGDNWVSQQTGRGAVQSIGTGLL